VRVGVVSGAIGSALTVGVGIAVAVHCGVHL
jgi:transketolase N-terminal domain/subunit